MRHLRKWPISLFFVVAILSIVVAWQLQSRAHDFWAYSKLGVSDGTPESAVYYLEVRGVGAQPKIARLVRFPDPSAPPANALEVSNRVLTELDSHVQNLDRWNTHCVLIAGRTNDEKIVVPIESSIAQKLFANPGSQFDSYQTLEELWNDKVVPKLPPSE